MISLQQHIIFRKRMLLYSDDVDISTYRFELTNNSLKVLNQDRVIVETDGVSYLSIEDCQYHRKDRRTYMLYNGDYFLDIDWCPNGEKQTFMVNRLYLNFEGMRYKMKHYRGLNWANITKREIMNTKDADLSKVLGCLAYLWMHCEYRRTKFHLH